MPLLRIVREGVPPRGSPRHVPCGTPIPSPYGWLRHPPDKPADSGIPCRRGQAGTAVGREGGQLGKMTTVRPAASRDYEGGRIRHWNGVVDSVRRTLGFRSAATTSYASHGFSFPCFAIPVNSSYCSRELQSRIIKGVKEKRRDYLWYLSSQANDVPTCPLRHGIPESAGLSGG